MSEPASESGGGTRKGSAHQAPRGTRDFYPIEMARRRWLEERWRRVAVRHGFDEIDGPTFEHLDLYTVKSGEGIVSELFSFTRAGGETAYALRPEFTPTLARMVAAKASALPKPTKWFSVGPYFRAERPQRGRLREFLQWNVDCLGDPSPEADAEVIACCVDSLRAMGLGPGDVRIKIGNRRDIEFSLLILKCGSEVRTRALEVLDAAKKLTHENLLQQLVAVGLHEPDAKSLMNDILSDRVERFDSDEVAAYYSQEIGDEGPHSWNHVLFPDLIDLGLKDWCEFDPSIVRGLAYYTGTVFEVHETGGKERAIAGGGRYDNLVELFGGPPTPAVGFAMGDVVVALVLQDKGLMPSDDAIARDLGLAPDVFVVTTGEESSEALLRPALAALRERGLHARRTYRSTRNVGKLLGEAGKSGARFALILEGSDGAGVRARLKDLSAERSGDGEALTAGDVGALASDVDGRVRPGARS